jgi:hypothetical protein
MKRPMPSFKKLFLIAALATTTLLSGCYGETGMSYGAPAMDRGHRGTYHNSDYQRQYGSYDYNHPDPAYNGYEADRYYCRRSDGSTGLIVGGLGGAAVGAMIAPGDSTALGAIIGAIGGAAVGGAIDSNNVRCR